MDYQVSKEAPIKEMKEEQTIGGGLESSSYSMISDEF